MGAASRQDFGVFAGSLGVGLQVPDVIMPGSCLNAMHPCRRQLVRCEKKIVSWHFPVQHPCHWAQFSPVLVLEACATFSIVSLNGFYCFLLHRIARLWHVVVYRETHARVVGIEVTHGLGKLPSRNLFRTRVDCSSVCFEWEK